MVFLCIKIFFARLLDVSISTFRTMIMMRGKKLISAFLAFLEVFVWFYAARTALTTEIHGLYLPISYSLGYATGSFIGMFLSEKFIKGVLGVQIITKKNTNSLIKAIKNKNIGVSEIKLSSKNKTMLYIQIKSNKLEILKEIVSKYDKEAFITITETKYVTNGWVK